MEDTAGTSGPKTLETIASMKLAALLATRVIAEIPIMVVADDHEIQAADKQHCQCPDGENAPVFCQPDRGSAVEQQE